MTCSSRYSHPNVGSSMADGVEDLMGQLLGYKGGDVTINDDIRRVRTSSGPAKVLNFSDVPCKLHHNSNRVQP